MSGPAAPATTTPIDEPVAGAPVDDVTAAGSGGDDPVPADGRAARAARTRQAIVDALLSLLEEGDLQPTANRIAERAGISLRLIYHHFGDLESLFRATAVRQAERMAAQVEPVDPGLPLEERIDAFVAQRARTLEWITPVTRAARLHEPFSEELRKARELFTRAGDLQVAALFADALDAHDEPERTEVLTALHLVTSWGGWDAIRGGGAEPAVAAAAMRCGVRSLLLP